MKKYLLFGSSLFWLLYLSSCNQGPEKNNAISTDTVATTKGAILFNQYCSSCHGFREKEIGPQLSGITKTISVEWLQNFIRNAQNVIQSKDKYADSLLQQYKTPMPSFDFLKDDDINNIIAFINTHNERKIEDTTTGLSDPIPQKISLSTLVASIKLVTTIPASIDSKKTPAARITKLDYQPNTNTLFVVDLRGKLYMLNNNKATVYMDMQKQQPNFINEPGLATGFGSFAFHPQFAKNGLFYTTHTEKPNSAKADFGYGDSIPVTLQWVLTEWKANDPKAIVVPLLATSLIRPFWAFLCFTLFGDNILFLFRL